MHRRWSAPKYEGKEEAHIDDTSVDEHVTPLKVQKSVAAPFCAVTQLSFLVHPLPLVLAKNSPSAAH